MSDQEIARISEEMIAAVNDHDIGRYKELLSDDIVVWNTRSPEPIRGKDAASEDLVHGIAAFSDYFVEPKNAVIGDDQFVVELEFGGTHDGTLELGPGMPPLPPTGNQVRTQGVFVATVKDGKVNEIRQYPNLMGMMMQLGLVSPPGSE